MPGFRYPHLGQWFNLFDRQSRWVQALAQERWVHYLGIIGLFKGYFAGFRISNFTRSDRNVTGTPTTGSAENAGVSDTTNARV